MSRKKRTGFERVTEGVTLVLVYLMVSRTRPPEPIAKAAPGVGPELPYGHDNVSVSWVFEAIPQMRDGFAGSPTKTMPAHWSGAQAALAIVTVVWVAEETVPVKRYAALR